MRPPKFYFQQTPLNLITVKAIIQLMCCGHAKTFYRRYLVIVIVITVSKCVSFNVVDWPHQHLQHVPPTQRQTVDSSDLLQ